MVAVFKGGIQIYDYSSYDLESSLDLYKLHCYIVFVSFCGHILNIGTSFLLIFNPNCKLPMPLGLYYIWSFTSNMMRPLIEILS